MKDKIKKDDYVYFGNVGINKDFKGNLLLVATDGEGGYLNMENDSENCMVPLGCASVFDLPPKFAKSLEETWAKEEGEDDHTFFELLPSYVQMRP